MLMALILHASALVMFGGGQGDLGGLGWGEKPPRMLSLSGTPKISPLLWRSAPVSVPTVSG